jgi:hypothetical protein
MDRRLYALADLVLLPFRDSHEDIRTVIRDLEMFPRAYAIPSQWPIIPWQRDAAENTVLQLLAPYKDRILNPVSALSSSKQLLYKTVPGQPPAPLVQACSGVARQVLELLQIPFQEMATQQRPSVAMAA